MLPRVHKALIALEAGHFITLEPGESLSRRPDQEFDVIVHPKPYYAACMSQELRLLDAAYQAAEPKKRVAYESFLKAVQAFEEGRDQDD